PRPRRHDRRRRQHPLQGRRPSCAGVSGGIWGLTEGYCLMVGGERDVVQRLAPIFTTLAPPDGWLHVGPVGSGHYVKMIHHGIALRALPLTSRELVRGPAARRAPQRLRWPCRPSMSRSRW